LTALSHTPPHSVRNFQPFGIFSSTLSRAMQTSSADALGWRSKRRRTAACLRIGPTVPSLLLSSLRPCCNPLTNPMAYIAASSSAWILSADAVVAWGG
jgi:hypothetical protein